MRVLVLGSGAREHALAWKIGQSPVVTQVYLAPGNDLASLDFTCLACAISDAESVLTVAHQHKIDFVVVGPEAPLYYGVVDRLKKAGVLVLGPTRSAAQLETSKVFAKKSMMAAWVPTARFESFTSLHAAKKWLAVNPGQYAVKADGLMAGKGVMLCQNSEQAMIAAEHLFSEDQKAIVIEELLSGKEASLIALCDGNTCKLLPLARDYKRIFDNNVGANTGGMGAVAPLANQSFHIKNTETLASIAIEPILKLQRERGDPFVGFLYAGLLFHRNEPMVLEYNVRLGDPETQVLMNVLDGDILPALYAAAHGDLAQAQFPSPVGAAVCVVIAAEGYPEKPVFGALIKGIETARAQPHVQVFGAGLRASDGGFVVSGGRVLSIVAQGDSISQARERAYRAAEKISFSGMQYRTDIAFDLN